MLNVMRVVVLVCAVLMGGASGAEVARSPVAAARILAERSELLRGYVSLEQFEKALGLPRGTNQCNGVVSAEAEVWVVTRSDEHAISLRLCGADDQVHVQAFPMTGGNALYIAASQTGNHGQTWAYEFWVGEGTSLGREDAKKLGLTRPRENEFLSRKDWFPTSDNHEVSLALSPEGKLEAEPWTWMDPKWENKTPVWKIHYEWDGRMFRKVRKRAT